MTTEDEFKTMQLAGEALARVGDTGRPTRKRSGRPVDHPEKGAEPASKRVKKESKASTVVEPPSDNAAAAINAVVSSSVAVILTDDRAPLLSSTTTNVKAKAKISVKTVSFAVSPSPSTSKTAKEPVELAEPVGLQHPHAPTLAKNAPKLMEGSDTIVWGFVGETEEGKKVWVEPPIVVDKYSRLPCGADHRYMVGRPYDKSRPNASTHNANTTTAAPGPFGWWDREDKFWVGDLKGKVKVVRVEWDGQRRTEKKLRSGQSSGWGHNGGNHWG